MTLLCAKGTITDLCKVKPKVDVVRAPPVKQA